MIKKKFCEDCEGLGHVPGCKCRGGVAFVMGCCKKCGGEGLLLDDEKPMGLVDEHSKLIVVSK